MTDFSIFESSNSTAKLRLIILSFVNNMLTSGRKLIEDSNNVNQQQDEGAKTFIFIAFIVFTLGFCVCCFLVMFLFNCIGRKTLNSLKRPSLQDYMGTKIQARLANDNSFQKKISRKSLEELQDLGLDREIFGANSKDSISEPESLSRFQSQFKTRSTPDFRSSESSQQSSNTKKLSNHKNHILRVFNELGILSDDWKEKVQPRIKRPDMKLNLESKLDQRRFINLKGLDPVDIELIENDVTRPSDSLEKLQKEKNPFTLEYFVFGVTVEYTKKEFLGLTGENFVAHFNQHVMKRRHPDLVIPDIERLKQCESSLQQYSSRCTRKSSLTSEIESIITQTSLPGSPIYQYTTSPSSSSHAPTVSMSSPRILESQESGQLLDNQNDRLAYQSGSSQESQDQSTIQSYQIFLADDNIDQIQVASQVSDAPNLESRQLTTLAALKNVCQHQEIQKKKKHPPLAQQILENGRASITRRLADCAEYILFGNSLLLQADDTDTTEIQEVTESESPVPYKPQSFYRKNSLFYDKIGKKLPKIDDSFLPCVLPHMRRQESDLCGHQGKSLLYDFSDENIYEVYVDIGLWSHKVTGEFTTSKKFNKLFGEGIHYEVVIEGLQSIFESMRFKTNIAKGPTVSQVGRESDGRQKFPHYLKITVPEWSEFNHETL